MSQSWTPCKMLFIVKPTAFLNILNIILIQYFYSHLWSIEFQVIITRVTLMKMINSLMYPGSLTLLKISVSECKFFSNPLLVTQNVSPKQ